MKALIVSLLLLIAPPVAIAQNNILFNLKSAEKRGDLLFESFSYQHSLEAYLQVLDKGLKNARVKLKVAECYRLLNKPHLAEEWYWQVIENDEVVESIHKLHYAQVLSSNGKYDMAEVWYKKYGAENSDDSRVQRKIASLLAIGTLFADSAVHFVDALAMNSEKSDFSPTFYKNGLVFVSGRDQNKKAINNEYNWDQSNFLDLFYVEKEGTEMGQKAVPFHENIVTSFHEGPCTFYDNETKMIFTANSYIDNELVTSKDGVTKLKLYYSELRDGQWNDAVPLPFNNDHYSVGHPSMAKSGDLLYFSSDMPGGFGGTDIYKCTYENGVWGEPENLGSFANTEGDEMFPYVHHDGVLYFASTGHGGLGGMDLYRLTADEKIIDNMGYPFNSRWDDFGLILQFDSESGYFSSNREGGIGDDDLYFYELKKIEAEFYVKDSISGEGIGDVRVALAYEDIGHSFFTNTTGNAKSLLNPLKDYTGDFTKEGYQTKDIFISVKELAQNNPYVEILMVPDVFTDSLLV